jgi:hypothetical protein
MLLAVLSNRKRQQSVRNVSHVAAIASSVGETTQSGVIYVWSFVRATFDFGKARDEEYHEHSACWHSRLSYAVRRFLRPKSLQKCLNPPEPD